MKRVIPRREWLTRKAYYLHLAEREAGLSALQWLAVVACCCVSALGALSLYVLFPIW